MKNNFFNNVYFFLAQFVMVMTWIFTFGTVTVIIRTGHDIAAVIQGWGDGIVELNFEEEKAND